MKKKEVSFRRFISVLLTAAVIFGAGTGSITGGTVNASLNVSAAQALVYGDYEYELGSDNTVTITKYKGSEQDLIIPGHINGLTVTHLGDSSFALNDYLVHVTIPDTVTSMGSWAFEFCENLTGVTVSQRMTNIGMRAFYSCGSLTDINIPDSVTKIESWAFEFCNSLETVSISKNVDSIANNAFYRCFSLKNIHVEAGNSRYMSLNGVLFNKDKTDLIGFPSGRTGVYTIPDGVTSLGSYTFTHCKNLKGVVIPESVNFIGHEVFSDCDSLTSITIPENVIYIGKEALVECDKLTEINVDEKNSVYSSENGVLFNKNKTTLICCPGGKPGSYTIPDTVTALEDYAFYGCKGLTDVVMSDSITEMGSVPFNYCENLVSVRLSGSIKEIVRMCFYDCRSLRSIDIPDGVVSIEDSAFGFCSGLTSAVIPDSVTSIGRDAFSGCRSLTIYGQKGSCAETYAAENSIPFKALGEEKISVRNASVTLSPASFTYDGSGKKPAVTVKDGTKTLVRGTDYTLSYENNTAAGYGKVIITGINGYTDTLETTFRISERSVTECTVTLDPESCTYDGSAKTPGVKVSDGSKKLVRGTDYTLTYSDNVQVGTASVTVTGKGNYTGKITRSFTITQPQKISITDMTITVNTSYGTVYNGREHKPQVTVQNGKTRLDEGADFTCTYSDNISAGTASVKIEGIGKYTGTVAKNFTIQPMSIAKAAVAVNAGSVVYDGRAKTPGVEVSLDGKTLVRGTDFSVAYSDNVNIGNALVTVKGKNNYTGQAQGHFLIVAGKKEFVWGQDNYNFINSSYLGYFPKTTYRDMINSTYRKLLASKYTLTNSEYQTVFVGKGGRRAWLDDLFGGACYGMSATLFLAKAGFMKPSDYLAGADYIYDLNAPIENDKLCSLITYYQMIQVKDVIQQQYRKVPMMSNKAVINGIRELIDKNSLVLIGFKKEGWGGHAIIAYGYDNDMHVINGKPYNGRIWICDPNASKSVNENFFIYYNSSDNYNWTIPGYKQSGDISSASGAIFNYYGASADDINSGGCLCRVNEISGSRTDYIARIDAYRLSGDSHVNKVTADPSLGGAYMNTASAPGEIVADYSYPLAGGSSGIPGYNLFDSSSAYKISQDETSELDLRIDYEYCDLSASAKAGDSVIFDSKGYILLDCDDSDYTLSMTWDGDYPTDWFTFSVSGTGANNVSLEKRSEGYVLSGDNIRGLKIRANNRSDTVTAGLSATKYRSVLIYETDNRTIGIRVDTDHNGTYETDLNALSLLENTSVISAEQINKGGTVKVTASASGGAGNYSYAVLYKKSISDKWTTVQGFSENRTVSIKPASSGEYEICVKVRDSRGTVEKKYFTLSVTAPLENDSTISATSISKGESVIVKADAAGGTGSYGYAVYYKKGSSSSWTTVQRYSTNSRVSIKPSASGTYDICVKVRDSSGSISKKYFTVIVTEPLTNKSAISSASIRPGSTVTVKAAASGGSGGYRYAVLYKKSSSSSWTTKQSYGTNTTVTIKPAAAVDYDICVKVVDSSGAVAKKTFTFRVVR